ncbi:hypothetical protein PVAP13_5NG446680 [Panicum virgatum]|uniref:Uncharacterized protein n=1 Tax=Panicum virgatum TaxID=38727 RepID=A0A8T0S084_PANVG|nr:hypothetical protein PVAP13_5NG446680 [Panicum virgatum]
MSSATSSAVFTAAALSSPSTQPRRSTTTSRPSAAPSTAGTWRRHRWRVRICRHCSSASLGGLHHSRDSCTQSVMVEPLL